MKAKLTALVLGLLILFPFTIAVAQTDDTTDTQPLENITCEQVLTKIDQKITSYKTKQPVHLATYEMLYLKVNTAVKQAKVLGYDTEEIEADLVELDILTAQFDNRFEDFITALESTKRYACNENAEAQYAQTFLNAMEGLEAVKDVADEIFDLYEDEIRENLLGLQKEVPAETSETLEIPTETTNE